MSSLLYSDIVATVGDTPLIKLNKLAAGLPASVYVKAEFFNPLASVKDRIGRAMRRTDVSGRIPLSSNRRRETRASRSHSCVRSVATSLSSRCRKRCLSSGACS